MLIKIANITELPKPEEPAIEEVLKAEVEQEVDAQAAEFAIELTTDVAPEFVEVFQDTVSIVTSYWIWHLVFIS